MLELLDPAPTNWLLRTVAEVKANKRMTINVEDALIEGWIRVAAEWLETEYQISIRPQKWRLTLPCFPDQIHLQNPPLRYALPAEPETAVAVKYRDVDNVEQTLASPAYRVFKSDMTWRVVASETWPDTKETPRAVRIEFDVGYTAPADVPMPIRQAGLLLASYYVQHRDATFEEPKISLIDRRIAFGVEALMKPYRVIARYSA
jgi:uncharacterized phiE125 gp8 family phage protein